MADINIGDVLYDCEAEGNLIGLVVARRYLGDWWLVEWNDGNGIQVHKDRVRDLKKEWHKIRKKYLNKKKK